MDIINVGIYGGKTIFGGKETPIVASVIRCDKYENCSYYKAGQCLNVVAPFSSGCKFGSVRKVQGYTSKAAKYYGFKKEWETHEKYGKLIHSPTKLGTIGDVVVFPYPYVSISEDGIIEDPTIGTHVVFIPRETFTINLVKSICEFRPHAIMGGEIKAYQTEIVPLFLAHLKEVLPSLYDEFRKTHSGLVKDVSYIGRTALLKTISPSVVQYKSDRYPKFNEQWVWDGEVLTRKDGYVSEFNITKDYEVLEIKIKPSDKSKVTISSNEQVNERTVFID